MVMEGS
jgi:hypothetical protein